MKWIVAHLIMINEMQLSKENIVFYEDCYLIHYDSEDILYNKIEKITSEINSSEKFISDGKVCKLKYLGIRKLTQVSSSCGSDLDLSKASEDGLSLSYSNYTVRNIEDANKIACGEEACIEFDEIIYP